MSQVADDVAIQTLVSITCSECGVAHGLPEHYRNARVDDHKPWYCPNGHSQYFPGKSEADKLRGQLEVQRRQSEWLQAQRDRRDRQLRYARGQVTKIKNRIAAGVCPCCSRSFANLARHMGSKHPGYTKQDIG